jgi:hypothetical protein
MTHDERIRFGRADATWLVLHLPITASVVLQQGAYANKEIAPTQSRPMAIDNE